MALLYTTIKIGMFKLFQLLKCINSEFILGFLLFFFLIAYAGSITLPYFGGWSVQTDSSF